MRADALLGLKPAATNTLVSITIPSMRQPVSVSRGFCTPGQGPGDAPAPSIEPPLRVRESSHRCRGIDPAIEDYNQAIEPDFADAFKGRGAVYAKKGQYDRAMQDLDEAIKLKPDDAEALNNRG